MPRLTALDLLEAQGLPRHMHLLSEEEAATLDREALEDDRDAVFQVSHSTHQRSERSLRRGLGHTLSFQRLGLPSTKHSKSFSAFGSQHRTSTMGMSVARKPVNATVYRCSYETPRSLPSLSSQRRRHQSFSSSVSTLSNLRKTANDCHVLRQSSEPINFGEVEREWGLAVSSADSAGSQGQVIQALCVWPM